MRTWRGRGEVAQIENGNRRWHLVTREWKKGKDGKKTKKRAKGGIKFVFIIWRNTLIILNRLNYSFIYLFLMVSQSKILPFFQCSNYPTPIPSLPPLFSFITLPFLSIPASILLSILMFLYNISPQNISLVFRCVLLHWRRLFIDNFSSPLYNLAFLSSSMAIWISSWLGLASFLVGGCGSFGLVHWFKWSSRLFAPHVQGSGPEVNSSHS